MKRFSEKLKAIPSILFAFFIAAALVLAVPACEPDEPDEPDPSNEMPTIYEWIQQLYFYMYYWNKEVNDYVIKKAPTSGDITTYFNSLKYDENKASVSDRIAGRYDRWGFIYSYKAFIDLMNSGKNLGFGYLPDITYSETDGFSIRVCMVYDGSPMDNAGVKRGYELLTINGKKAIEPFYSSQSALNQALGNLNEELSKESNTYLFADREGNPISNGEIRISAGEFTVQPIFHTDTYNVDEKKVGYIIYNEFLTGSKENIIATLNEFAATGIDELVLDLRYNGGGDTDVAERIAECLLPQSAGTDSVLFATYVYSDLAKHRSSWLKDHVSKVKRNVSALNIQRLFIITTYRTASASEEIINGLKPFFSGDVITVGTTTDGKPVGMNTYIYPLYDNDEIEAGKVPEWIIAPITFRIDNKNGEGSYFAGISPAFEVQDDLYHDFGVDPETLEGEECLQTIMEYIKTGDWPRIKSVKAVNKELPRLIQLKGLQIHAGCI